MYQNVVSAQGLRPIGNQIPQPRLGREKFPNDDSHQAEADIYLHIADDHWQGAGQKNFKQYIPPGSAQGIDQFDLILVQGGKTSVKSEDGTEERYRHSGHDDGIHVISQPYDEKRGQGGFREAVEHHEEWLQYFRQAAPEPQQ